MIRSLPRGGGFALALGLVLAATALAQQRTLLAVEASQNGARRDGAGAATVTLSSQGGYRWSKTERISVTERDGKCAITIERVSYENQKQGPSTLAITKEQHDALVAVLEKNDALKLKDDFSKKVGTTDLPEYDISVTVKDKSNRFRVFGPQIMGNGYTKIVDAIEALAEKALPSPAL